MSCRILELKPKECNCSFLTCQEPPVIAPFGRSTLVIARHSRTRTLRSRSFLMHSEIRRFLVRQKSTSVRARSRASKHSKAHVACAREANLAPTPN